MSTGSVADFTDRCGRLTRVTGPDEGDDGPERHHRLPVDPDVEADEDDRRLGHTTTVPHELGAVLADGAADSQEIPDAQGAARVVPDRQPSVRPQATQCGVCQKHAKHPRHWRGQHRPRNRQHSGQRQRYAGIEQRRLLPACRQP